MKLVVDSNVVISALVRNSKTRELLFNNVLEFYSPDYLFDELAEHADEIISKAGISIEDFNVFLDALKKVIKLLPSGAYSNYLADAKAVIDDLDDAPFLAAAFFLNSSMQNEDCGIWSNDKDFLEKEELLSRKFGLKTFSTKTLSKFRDNQFE